jgi:hypothetical protein
MSRVHKSSHSLPSHQSSLAVEEPGSSQNLHPPSSGSALESWPVRIVVTDQAGDLSRSGDQDIAR